MKLTPHMHTALTKAKHAPLRRPLPPGPGAPPWPAPACTLRALERHELVTCGQVRHRDGFPVTTWTITDTGRQALQPPERFVIERPVYLARPTKNSGDYTRDPSRRIDHLPVLEDASPEWRRHAEARRAGAENPRDRARRAARNMRAAA